MNNNSSKISGSALTFGFAFATAGTSVFGAIMFIICMVSQFTSSPIAFSAAPKAAYIGCAIGFVTGLIFRHIIHYIANRERHS